MVKSISKYSLLLTLLLCNVCSNGIIVQAKPNTGLLANPSGSNTNIKLDNLIDDVLLLIFDVLDFDDLIYMGATNTKFNTIAEMVFHQRYPNYEIRIIGAGEYRGSKKFHVAKKYEKFIEIAESEWIEDVFKYAGKWIQKLSIQSHKMQNPKRIYEIVNKYTSESLPHLDLRWIKNDTFNSFAMPFNALEELHFLVDEEKPSANMQPLNQIFPKLRRMSVSLNTDLDYNCLDSDFQHLEHLETYIKSSDSSKQKMQFESLLHKNPQIRSINLWNFPNNYVITINKLLPKLENLTLHSFGGLDETVHFENVKNLQISVSHPIDIEKLIFSHLELLDMDFSSIFNELITFFGNHQNLSKLHLHIFGRSTDGQALVDLVSNVPNLVELKMVWGQPIGPQFIAQIIQSHEKLRTIQFSVNEMDVRFDKATRDEFKKFRQQYGDEWHIRNLINRFIVEKKN